MEYQEQPLITIYTQAYNSEKYIEQCILSVLQQTYTKFEYFICNHGSKDNTLNLIQKYAALDNRIIVLDMPNEARGFYPELICREGKGKYFAMLDSDDMWMVNYLEHLLNYAETNQLDMVVCGIAALNSDKNDLSLLRKSEESYCFDIKDNQRYFTQIYNFLRTTWGKLILMEKLRQADFTVYKKNAITMISDDTAFSLAIYQHCSRIGALEDVLLIYRFHSESITAKFKPSMNENNINIYYLTSEVLSAIGDDSKESQHMMMNVYLSSVREALLLLATGDTGDDYKIQMIAETIDNEVLEQFREKGIEYFPVLEEALEYAIECAEEHRLTKSSEENLHRILSIIKCLNR